MHDRVVSLLFVIVRSVLSGFRIAGLPKVMPRLGYALMEDVAEWLSQSCAQR
jgi:hypothetical protein